VNLKLATFSASWQGPRLQPLIKEKDIPAIARLQTIYGAIFTVKGMRETGAAELQRGRAFSVAGLDALWSSRALRQPAVAQFGLPRPPRTGGPAPGSLVLRRELLGRLLALLALLPACTGD
jgi:hypothetical protein